MESVDRLPRYEKPPLVEVAISIVFSEVPGLNEAHIGAFWWTLRSSFPKVITQPAVPAPAESFSNSPWFPPQLQFGLSNQPAIRVQMISDDDQWLCQLQRDRIVINWRKGEQDYPRFEQALNKLLRVWEQWLNHVQELGFERPKPTISELIYVNVLPQGVVWHQLNELDLLLPRLVRSEQQVMENLPFAGFRSEFAWRDPEKKSTISVDLRPIKTDEVLAMLLNLSVRSQIDSNSASELKMSFEYGNLLIRNYFESVISDEARVAWEVKYPAS